MEERKNRIVSLPTEAGSAEERMLGADLVREMVARKRRGEGAKRHKLLCLTRTHSIYRALKYCHNGLNLLNQNFHFADSASHDARWLVNAKFEMNFRFKELFIMIISDNTSV